MKLNQLVFKSMLKNIKHYYLYFFALIFSVTLYFSFVTLQYNESVMQTAANSGSAAAGLKAATYILYFIVLLFVLYANHLFMKRRSKEIGLYQLIGMTKGLIIRLIALENIVLFVGAVIVGMLFGFLSSRIFAMLLLKILEQDTVVAMSFSMEAVKQTVLLFAILLAIILVQMAFMIRRVSLLSLFTASKQADERVKRVSPLQMMMGAIGIGLISYGYYASTQLFSEDSANQLFLNMMIILATTIGGTFFVFRFSIAFVLNLMRMKKNGHLSPVDVLALTPIMHRMKGNAKSLTLITILTAVSLAISILSYISYYSAGEKAFSDSPTDYTLYDDNGKEFLAALDAEEIDYDAVDLRLQKMEFSLEELVAEHMKNNDMWNMDMEIHAVPLSDYAKRYPGLKLKGNEAIITGYNNLLSEMLPLEPGNVTMKAGDQSYPVEVMKIKDEYLIGGIVAGNGPALVVSDALFEQLVQHKDMSVWHKQTSLSLNDRGDLAHAETLYKETGANHNEFYKADEKGELHLNTRDQSSLEGSRTNYIGMMGVTIFTTAFLGLAFLVATGSILYFKQMTEAEEEREAYTILRKVGFTQQEILRGVYMKQAFNFGLPLAIGLLHSYFAVKSGWFLFGSELVRPLLITMGLYIVLYIIFALLSISYYKKVIKESL
ncbi:FtsX-like permease family protein [Solibacillus cecembensis]|uniref:FtsX-like permease family protein n=1 Tax=Solibacillus cecembensis TaxID=459347 RepID=UPI003D02A398